MLNHKLHLNEKVLVKDTDKRATREGFGYAVTNIAEKNSDIVVLSADLSSSLKLEKFIKGNPKRFIQCGIAEQNMASIAAGLALEGKIAFVTSFACFSPSRNWDQIRMSIAQQCANVKIIGSHAGLSAASDGRSAQALEDVALMRVLPNMVVIQPCDYFQTVRTIEESVKHKGSVYIRLHREPLPDITTEKTPFEIGKAYTYVEGKDATIFASGPISLEVIKAVSNIKAKHKIDIELVIVPTIKPLDEETILSSAEKTKKVITVEEHQVIGGLGSAISELLSEKLPTRVLRIGMNEEFGESGTYAELLDKFELSAHHIERKVLEFIK
jgi:transketolase